MKKIIYGLTSISLALVVVSSTKVKLKRFTTCYWFCYTNNGITLSTVYPTHLGTGGAPPTTCTCPESCGIFGDIKCCAGFTSFTANKYMIGASTWYYFKPTGIVCDILHKIRI